MKKLNKRFVIFIFSCSLILSPFSISHAQAESNAGYIAGSGFSSLIYTPIKIASALLLGITGGLSLMGTIPAGAEQKSIDIVKTGMSGDWWISPEHLQIGRAHV